jgi:tetratricopeptide (TPR) repeat protein
MNDNPENPTKRPLVTRFFRWLFSWRIIRRMLIALAGLITLVALLITEENWRGKHAWEKYKREMEAKGERFDIASVAPPPVPDAQNFFAASIVVSVLGLKNQTDSENLAGDLSIYRGNSKLWPTNGGSWQKATFADLQEWQHYFRKLAESSTNAFPVPSQPTTPAADVLLALSIFDSQVEELRQASQRPYSRFPFNYDNGFADVGKLLPSLAGEKRCIQLLRLRAIAEVNDGKSDKALDDIKLMLHMTDSIRDQPFLITHLVRIAMMTITLQPIYEGLARHQWSETQLAELEQRLAKVDFLADFQTAMRGERACAIESFENQRRTREIIEPQGDGESTADKPVILSLRFMPSAYFYQNELAFAREHEQFILPLVDLTNRIAAPAVLRQSEAAVSNQMKHAFALYQAQALMVFPAISKSVTKCAAIQAQVDLARVACALERYRRAHAEYPETLDVLAPQFIEKLPHDITNGQPLKYRRSEDGQFVLYSVGWNETDDGGIVALKKTGSLDSEKGDWVWQYPIK